MAVSEETRAKMSAAAKSRSPETRARMAAAQKARWADPEKRKELAEQAAAARRRPEVRAKISAAMKALPAPSAETRALMSAAQKARWEDPEARRDISVKVKALYQDPEFRQRMHEAQRASWADLPEWIGPFLERAKIIVLLREQDGDLCQLCLEPIDFELTYPHPGYVNVDHIRPRASGGTDDPDNLWLSHYSCNIRKGARRVGRPDGTTNRRAP